MPAFPSCATVLVTVLAVTASLSIASATSAEDSDLPKLLQTFVDELVAITPGTGQYPAELVRPAGRAGVQEIRVKLAGDFAIAKYEVPQNLYAAVMGENPSRWKGPRNSAEMMTWDEARQFCARLTRLLRDANLIGGTEVIRLPTEIEWEYCCRAGTASAYSFGDAAQADGDEGNKASLLDPYAWHTGNAAGNDPPVGALRPNPWGLYDMHGYLWEFCSDGWSDTVNTTGVRRAEAAPPEQIVLRGGSWKDRFDQLTSVSRRKFGTTARDDAVGLRCVRAPAP